ncbi:hypothetical protein GUJ93_ZPchr0012g21070 [Zizania palustris]|uniref:Uncharacterized protein n=1 Tax=Zizania palustris TaxID=103762 RepID=A0A8J6BVJ9_ZIZPA|nr:hypothetical protein GUJ93_ZPchr0012g21070 [Zizania palustris]
MEIRALAPPPVTAGFRRTALRTSFLNGSVSLSRVQVRQTNVIGLSAIVSGVTSLIDYPGCQVLSSFEDPEKILDQAVLEMNDDLTKMRQATAQVLASQKRLENKYKAAEQASDDWYRRAQLALQKGDEDLLVKPLSGDNASSLRAQLDQQKGVVENLISNTRNGNGIQAEALGQLATDDLEGKFALLETSSVDDDLAQMKKELSGSARKGELPPGRTAVSNSGAAQKIEVACGIGGHGSPAATTRLLVAVVLVAITAVSFAGCADAARPAPPSAAALEAAKAAGFVDADGDASFGAKCRRRRTLSSYSSS